MRRIIVMNAKGGSGKTTISTNLASYYAGKGYKTALFDYDPQGSSSCWLEMREPHRAAIEGVCATKTTNGMMTRSFQLRVPAGTQRVIIDTPAGLDKIQLADQLRGIDLVLVPVLPSPIDTRAGANFIRDLMLAARMAGNRRIPPIAIIANRVREHTIAFQNLERFLDSLSIPVIAKLRDAQSYVRAADLGLGIHELESQRVGEDTKHWRNVFNWIEGRVNDNGDTSRYAPHPNVVSA